MIIAMRTVGMVEVAAHDIVEVISVRRPFMAAGRAMSVFAIVSFAFMVGGALVRVGATYRDGVLVDVTVVDGMQVTIMEVVRMSIVLNGRVPATRTVGVIVRCMFSTLRFLHKSPL